MKLYFQVTREENTTQYRIACYQEVETEVVMHNQG